MNAHPSDHDTNSTLSEHLAWQALQSTVAVYWPQTVGLIKLTGADRARFLHNQSTNDIQGLRVGQFCETVFVTSTGRTLDLTTALILDQEMILQVSPQRRDFLLGWMDRYLFPMDNVQLHDLSSTYTWISLIGPGAKAQLAQWGLPVPSPSQMALAGPSDAPFYLLPQTGLDLPGYTIIFPVTQQTQFQPWIESAGLEVMGEDLWEHLRVQQGRPAPGMELTEDYNPLEAGLWRAISFTKGCYIGQETIARLNTYQGVKQRLWGIRLERPVAPGTPLMVAEEKVGLITSLSPLDSGLGLAYVRTKAGGQDLRVQAGDSTGLITAVPYLSHEYYRPSSS
ncbi:folate-binding protein [Synechocystis sp. LKSZ1]|uniref:CAF17-like 4Fe-4S cluster assembly/insertion protein YgfZ n=1 Tax=Synechocystis sp. LKSZ1 TaxID=3144951 RepID=UPI00336BD06D